jgi:rod shape-determining protein MreC
MLRRSHYIALALVVVVVLILLNLPDHAATRLKLAIGGLFLPLFGVTSASQQLASRTGDSLMSRTDLLKENASLRRDNHQAGIQAMQSAEIARENNRLRQLLGWQPKTPWKLKLANVVLRDPANWWRTVEIDLGSRDGLRPNLPVLTPDGLVGRIASVGLTRSQVILVGDQNCKVAALVENENRDMGILGAADPFDSSLLTLGYLSRESVVKPGQMVSTSGLGGIFPKGIPIGTVVDSHPVEFGLYAEARVKLAARLSALEEVWVLFP